MRQPIGMPDHIHDQTHSGRWRIAGLALAAVMGVFQIINAVRVIADAAGFADYMGLPIGDGPDAFVQVYALRSLFIGIMVLGLVAGARTGVLAWMAAVGILLPLGDMWLTSAGGAPAAVVARHGVIAAYLVVTAIVLSLAVRRS